MRLVRAILRIGLILLIVGALLVLVLPAGRTWATNTARNIFAQPTTTTLAPSAEDSEAVALAQQAQKAEEEARLAKDAQIKAENDAKTASEKAEAEAKARQELQAKAETQQLSYGTGASAQLTETFVLAWPEDDDAKVWYRSPFTATIDALADKATWEIFAEPGVLLDATAAFDYLTASETPVNVPEGAYTYLAFGAGTIDGLKLNHQARNIYLVIARGTPSDGKPETDLNSTAMVTGYVRGAGIFSVMPAGAYVSLDWMLQQVENGFADSPNCGVDGCAKVTVVAMDWPTRAYRMWEITNPQKIREWTRVK